MITAAFVIGCITAVVATLLITVSAAPRSGAVVDRPALLVASILVAFIWHLTFGLVRS